MRDASRVLISKSARLWLLVGFCCAAPAFGSGAGAALPQQSVSQQRLPGQSASKNAALQGVVRDANAKPVIGARVIMRNLATDQKIEKISNAQGVFRFIDVARGDYELKIVAPDFQDFSNPAIQLKSGDDLVREIPLTALPSVAPTQPQFPRLPAVITNPPTEDR